MNDKEELFPVFQKSISNLIEDEEGNIPSNKLLMLGTLIIVLGSFFSMDAFAAHRSHSSHSSHSSHRSHSSGSHGNHSNHGSHISHTSHVSHTSHSNSASHSNSLYSAEGDVKYSAPNAYSVPGIKVAPITTTNTTFVLPEVNENFELPNGTPNSGIIPALSVASTTPIAKTNNGEMHTASPTKKVE